MGDLKKIHQQVFEFQEIDTTSETVNKKLDELIDLLAKSNIDSESAKLLQHKFNTAITRVEVTLKDIKNFNLESKEASREELLEDLESFLTFHQLDSTHTNKILIWEKAKRVSLVFISLILITLGFAMIIMPAPPNFEMFTVFYFNINDGITLMDLIALLIVFSGIYIFISSLMRRNSQD